MTWWEQPHDLSKFEIKHEAGEEYLTLVCTHSPQPSEPQDFSSGPELIILNAIHMPVADEIEYLGNMLFNIGGIKHVCEGDYPDGIYDDPLILRQFTPHVYGWVADEPDT